MNGNTNGEKPERTPEDNDSKLVPHETELESGSLDEEPLELGHREIADEGNGDGNSTNPELPVEENVSDSIANRKIIEPSSYYDESLDLNDPDAATQLKADDDFMLTPLGLDGESEDSWEDSGTQVIALDSESFDEAADTMLGGAAMSSGAAALADQLGWMGSPIVEMSSTIKYSKNEVSDFGAVIKTNIKHIDKLMKTYHDKISEAEGRVRLEERRVMTVRAELDKQFSAQSGRFENTIEESVKHLHQELDAVREKFLYFQQFEAVVQYWESKSTSHYKHYMWYAFVALLVAIAGLVSLVFWSQFNQAKLSMLSNPTAWHVLPITTPLIVVAVVVFWLLRLLIRITLSNFHLATDASERVVMAKMYLALLAKEGKLDEAAKIVILTQLFRRAATGLVKDDAAPPIPLKYLTEDRAGI